VPYLKKEINLNKFDNNLNEKILLNSDGMGYGLFSIEKNFLRENWGDLSDLERASAFVKLYEQLMQNNGTIEPQEYIELIIWAVGREKNPLIINHIMRQTIDIYWSLFNQKNRIDIAPFLEKAIWNQVVNEAHNTGIRRIYFRNYANLALTPSALSNVQSVWNESLKIKNLNLSTRDYTNIAASLAIKIPNSADQIIETQLLKIKGPDNKARFQFIIPALSSDQYIRDNFFSTLMKAENRHTEPWVLSALRYLHHPLRIDFSEGYLKRSLNVLEDIQITGDIFFPGRWLNATFKYYQSDVAIATVNNFLTKNPDYNYQLKLKILQNSDQMKRANKILKNTT
jgi:aminopeptidase N